ncbi:MAG: class II fumarate hydratase [Aigarchaeota archaeon]|nr:class II fumarate hydratase [Aigarchaeota archaeon]MDW8092693.1 class II fumarate hydratase [Nitrososphaerota archaeon]
MRYRVERDTLGELSIPEDAYYGVQTARALSNFPISGLRFQRHFIRSLALIKYAAAKANASLGLLPKDKAEAIMKAAMEVVNGDHDSQFVVDVLQTGSGTSTNMNANEVIANRAVEILGGKRGDKALIHPNDHVNMCQSTNDVFPTSIHVAAVELVKSRLIPSLKELENALNKKADEFKDVVKSGRTHLQDAVPVTLGQEFGGYAEMIRKGTVRLNRVVEDLLELPIGGTATGTGLNAHPEFAGLVVNTLNEITDLGFRIARDRFEAMGSKDSCVELSGVLRVIAGSLLKICNDLRLLASGPNTGLAEIDIPAVQPGSSIMPGKVNPVIIESTMLACCLVIGNDEAVFQASRIGELELNMGMPLIGYSLIQSIEVLSNAAANLARQCISGITANVDVCKRYAESSPALVTVIAPIIGYDKAAVIAKRFLNEKKSLRDLLIEEGVQRERVEKMLDLLKLTRGGLPSLER